MNHETPKQAANRFVAKLLTKGFIKQALHEYHTPEGHTLYWPIRLKYLESNQKWIRPMHRNEQGEFTLSEPGFPGKKPLYRLPSIVANSQTTIWIVEGEFCADKLNSLGLIATTSGGADSANTVDWSPLVNRTIILWPDNDKAGLEYAEKVILELKKRNCEISVVDIAQLQLPAKGDCVDWLLANPTANIKTLEALPLKKIIRGQLQTKLPYGFTLDESGGYYTEHQEEDEVKHWLCSKLEVTAQVRDVASENWSKLLEFYDADQQPHRWVMQNALLAGDAKMLDERQQKTWDYSNKPNVIHSELLIPNHSPTWLKKLSNSESLWNIVEKSEKRIDAQLAREIEFALPIELNQEQNIQLAREFIHDQFVLLGMIADWAVHWEDGNPHVHMMLTMRELTDVGFGHKVVAWNNKALLHEWRKQWANYANYANFHLRLHQVDHRSYQNQGIELIPTLHQKRAVEEMERRGIRTDILKEANAIRRENLKRIQTKPQILFDKLIAQRDTFTKENVICELGRYIPDKGFVLNPNVMDKILKNLEYHESVFKEHDLAKALLPLIHSPDEFALALQAIKSSDQLIPLGMGGDGSEQFTSRAMLKLEGQIQTIAEQLKTQRHHYLSQQRIEKVLKNYQQQFGKSFTSEQLLAIKHLVKHHSITCLVGRAGTGKSFSLGAARTIWEASGLQIHGIALSGIAADGLSKDAGIASRTIESFRYAIANKTIELSKHDVVVMDEAGMTDSVSLLAVLKAIQTAKAKLVLVGDPSQLQPVGPGATFRALLERIGFVELQTIYRQKEAWQRKATVHFSSGQIAKGLKAYFDAGCIHFAEDEFSAQQQLIADWQELRESANKNIAEHLIIAHSNKDVIALNQLARDKRIQQQELTSGYKVTTQRSDIEISIGDRLLFLKNNRELGVSNGRFATILNIDFTELGWVKNITVQLDGQAKKTVTFNLKHYPDFTYGYAATIHKTQGITVDHTFVLASGKGWNRPLTYVAHSRHCESCHLYTDKTTHTDFRQLAQQLSRSGKKESLLDFPQAFANRRGIETTGLRKYWRQFKTHITTQLEKIIAPKPIETQQAFSEKDQKDLQQLLITYIDQECELTHLVTQMHTTRRNNPTAAKDYAQQAHMLEGKIKCLAAKIIQHPMMKNKIQTLSKQHEISIVKLGEFAAMKQRLSDQGLSAQDITALIKHMHSKIQKMTRSLQQAQDREGRSY